MHMSQKGLSVTSELLSFKARRVGGWMSVTPPRSISSALGLASLAAQVRIWKIVYTHLLRVKQR